MICESFHGNIISQTWVEYNGGKIDEIKFHLNKLIQNNRRLNSYPAVY